MVKAAAPFGGGLALSKGICGGISGTAMALGLKFGSLEPSGEARRRPYGLTRAIMERFRQRFGSTQCGDLTRQWQDNFFCRERVMSCAAQMRFLTEELDAVLEAPEGAVYEESWWADYLGRRDSYDETIGREGGSGAGGTP